MLGKVKTPPCVAFGQVLRQLRQERLLSQERLAFEADIQRNYVSLIERGINQPTVTTIFKLAAALDVRPSALMSFVEIRVFAQEEALPTPDQTK
jgi:transcriptional regulator with XRE-family HTH domain